MEAGYQGINFDAYAVENSNLARECKGLNIIPEVHAPVIVLVPIGTASAINNIILITITALDDCEY